MKVAGSIFGQQQLGRLAASAGGAADGRAMLVGVVEKTDVAADHFLTGEADQFARGGDGLLDAQVADGRHGAALQQEELLRRPKRHGHPCQDVPARGAGRNDVVQESRSDATVVFPAKGKNCAHGRCFRRTQFVEVGGEIARLIAGTATTAQPVFGSIEAHPHRIVPLAVQMNLQGYRFHGTSGSDCRTPPRVN